MLAIRSIGRDTSWSRDFQGRSLTSAPPASLLHDYKIPTVADIPRIDAFFVHGADVVANHTGAKGLAEPPIIPTVPAIANAVADALGVEMLEIPLTPWRVLSAIHGAKAERRSA